MSRGRLLATSVIAGLGLAAAWQVSGLHLGDSEERRLAQRLPNFARAAALPSCAGAGQSGLRLLILGQSNAGNHGAPANKDDHALLDLWTPQGCVQATDPLPGGSGTGGSIWSHLPDALQTLGRRHRLSLAVIAVDASSISDWSDAKGPLGRHLRQRLQALNAAGWQPDLVLWQQGEADMRKGTAQAEYKEGFERLRLSLREQGIAAPMLLARSTLCAGRRSEQVRAAIDDLQRRHTDLLAGPDTDQLDAAAARFGACHFSQPGLTQAAGLWARAIDDALRALKIGEAAARPASTLWSATGQEPTLRP
ncbi:hypothetical protein OOZ63_24615 [Paucibacter sp. PLA-PC-4]|uniref:sialate O-acetylesterase n=1 Tax=Paucibacter sp. PLA-PC-4 TaxID=2993655 RepID=UPI00224B8072|nr:sialate O-acetylesterase [Paucibacter sp. PLA-PC-4]MCX2865015.1 hypothetical protein [Paucibacter sp. PLA-PC-4]